jgi:hypothetical protein
MIIVEGPDGSGKTTLIKNILDAYPDLTVAPRVVSKETNDLVDLQQWVDQNLAEGFQYTLFDRYRLISEFIYGPVLRKEQRAGFTSPAWVHGSLRRFYQLKPIIIYCLPPLSVVKMNIAGDETNRAVWDHVEQLYTAYLQRASLDVIHAGAVVYDYTVWSDRDPLGPLYLPLNRAQERAFL